MLKHKLFGPALSIFDSELDYVQTFAFPVSAYSEYCWRGPYIWRTTGLLNSHLDKAHRNKCVM